MRHLIIGLFIILYSSGISNAQSAEDKLKIYDPQADAYEEIHHAVMQAMKENKHILLQIGGNWCIWCMRFNKLVTSDTTLKGIIDSNYIIVHINYSPENKNLKVLESLGYPQRFGYPVFVVMDSHGNRLHTQNSAYLEEGQGYSKKKAEEFLRQWSPAALDPNTYNKQEHK